MRLFVRSLALAMIAVVVQLEIAGLGALARDIAIGNGPLRIGLVPRGAAPPPAPRQSARAAAKSLAAHAEPRGVSRCESLRLSIVSEAEQPELSLATLDDPASGKWVLVRVGDRALGHEVVLIGGDAARRPTVWLRRQGRVCTVPLGESPPAVAAMPPAPRASLRPEDVLGPVRALRRSDGGPGVVLRGIDPGSLLSRLGVQDGDVLESVNGFDLSQPSSALRAYAALRTANELRVKLIRRGRPIVLRFYLV